MLASPLVRKSWNESDHPRDHGKFAEKEGDNEVAERIKRTDPNTVADHIVSAMANEHIGRRGVSAAIKSALNLPQVPPAKISDNPEINAIRLTKAAEGLSSVKDLDFKINAMWEHHAEYVAAFHEAGPRTLEKARQAIKDATQKAKDNQQVYVDALLGQLPKSQNPIRLALSKVDESIRPIAEQLQAIIDKDPAKRSRAAMRIVSWLKEADAQKVGESPDFWKWGKSLRTPLVRKSASDWSHSTGERGGSVWTNRKTGQTVHQKDNPGGAERGQGQDDAPKGGGLSDDKAAGYAKQMREKFGEGAAAKIEAMIAANPEKKADLDRVKEALQPKAESPLKPKDPTDPASLLKDAITRSNDRENYPRETSQKVIDSLGSLSKDALAKVLKDAYEGQELTPAIRPGQSKKEMLMKLYEFLDAGHRAYERVQATLRTPFVRKSLDTDLGDETERLDLIAEIIAAIMGDKAEKGLRTPLICKAWSEVDHPRGKGGRFIPKGSKEAVDAAKAKVAEVLKAPKTPETQKKLLDHLSILSVKQLHELKKEYQLSASGPNVAALRKKIAERLGKGRTEKPEGESPSYKDWAKGEREGRKQTEEAPDTAAAQAPDITEADAKARKRVHGLITGNKPAPIPSPLKPKNPSTGVDNGREGGKMTEESKPKGGQAMASTVQFRTSVNAKSARAMSDELADYDESDVGREAKMASDATVINSDALGVDLAKLHWAAADAHKKARDVLQKSPGQLERIAGIDHEKAREAHEQAAKEYEKARGARWSA